ncbi:OsmC family protein [bacterium]|nr:OsmC family protein [bacterium]
MQKIIDVSFPGGKKVNALIGDTLIKTDQSVLSGGEGSAPEPFQLFLASIAACAGIYASEFCRTRNIDLESLSLKMICNFDPDVKQYTKMKIVLTVPPEFPDKYKEGIRRSMDLCAVKRHIINPPAFDIAVETV